MIDLKSLVPWGAKTAPTRIDPHDPFATFRREMDRLFDDVMGGRSFPFGMAAPTLVSPQIDVSETEKEITVSVELPGVDPKDVELTLVGDVLTVKGEKKLEEENKEAGHHVVERAYGAFTRSIRLPFDLDQAKAEASYDKGVLTIRLPKPEEAQKPSKRIEIKTAA